MPSKNKENNKGKRNSVSCPPKLLEYIDLANFSERNLELYNFSTNLRGYAEKQGFNKLTDKQVIEWFQKELTNEPKRIKEFIFEPIKTFSGEKEHFRTADARLLWLVERKFSTIVSIQKILTRMAFAFWEDENGDLHAFQIKDPTEFSTPVSVYVDENGFFRADINELINLMNEVNITANRLRRCFICKTIFWAKRIDAYSCQKSCANAFRQKLWRDRNKEEYNEKRRANREYKKKSEKMKTNKLRRNKNGTL